MYLTHRGTLTVPTTPGQWKGNPHFPDLKTGNLIIKCIIVSFTGYPENPYPQSYHKVSSSWQRELNL